jgi:DNA-binding MarR family transcriptional regulator
MLPNKAFAADERPSQETLERLVRRRRRVRGLFICGPIPLEWACRAARLPGKAITVALLIWYRDGFSPGKALTLGTRLQKDFGLSRKAVYRAVAHLTDAGLIRVERPPGAKPRLRVVLPGEPP